MSLTAQTPVDTPVAIDTDAAPLIQPFTLTIPARYDTTSQVVKVGGGRPLLLNVPPITFTASLEEQTVTRILVS